MKSDWGISSGPPRVFASSRPFPLCYMPFFFFQLLPVSGWGCRRSVHRMLSPPSRLARAPRSSHQLVTWRSAAALTPPPPRDRRPRPQSAGAARRLPPDEPDEPDAPASCNLSTQQAPLRTTPRRQPTDEPARGSARGWARPAPPGMFCTPRGSYSASSLLTARRVEQRELSARAAAAEAAEAEARLPQHVRSPGAACIPPSPWSVACSPVHCGRNQPGVVPAALNTVPPRCSRRTRCACSILRSTGGAREQCTLLACGARTIAAGP